MAKAASVALVMEDQALISMDLELTLGNAGFDVTCVISCQEATKWLENCRPDIVIVDVELRDGPSNKVVERLVEDGIPFIVHSGDDMNMHVGTPFAHGRWLGKPAAAEELIAAAMALLSS